MIRSLLLWLMLALPASAQSLPDWQHTSINDFARVLTDEDARTLDQALIDLNHTTGVEGTVVTLTGRSEYGGGLEDFATRLFNHWGVGDAQRNDGFMVLVIPSAHEARIELGRGYGARAAREAAAIMDQQMIPAFRQNDYSRGIRQGTLAVMDRIARPQVGGGAGTAAPPDDGDSLLSDPGLGIFGAAVLGMFGLAGWNRRRADRCPQCGHKGLVRTPNPGTPGRVMRSCPSCGWSGTSGFRPTRSVSSTRGNRDRGGRGGGFGGGSSGGGGASGRW